MPKKVKNFFLHSQPAPPEAATEKAESLKGSFLSNGEKPLTNFLEE